MQRQLPCSARREPAESIKHKMVGAVRCAGLIIHCLVMRRLWQIHIISPFATPLIIMKTPKPMRKRLTTLLVAVYIRTRRVLCLMVWTMRVSGCCSALMSGIGKTQSLGMFI